MYAYLLGFKVTKETSSHALNTFPANDSTHKASVIKSRLQRVDCALREINEMETWWDHFDAFEKRTDCPCIVVDAKFEIGWRFQEE